MPRNTLIEGDPFDPSDTDIIMQVDTLDVGKPVPDGWRVMTGNNMFSEIRRVAYRYEIEDESNG